MVFIDNYVIVFNMVNGSPMFKFVTRVDGNDAIAGEDPPMTFSDAEAFEVMQGLTEHGHPAAILTAIRGSLPIDGCAG